MTSRCVERTDIVRDPTPAEMVTAVSEGMLVEMLELSRMPGSEFVDEGDLVWLTGHIGGGNVLLAQIDRDVDARIDELARRFHVRGLPVVWWVDDRSRPADLGDRLRRRGWEHVPGAGMALPIASLREPSTVPGVEVREVEVDVRPEVYLEFGRGAFAWSDDAAVGRRLRIVHDDRPDRPRRHFLAFLDGRPVAASTIYTRHGIAQVAGIVTLPEYRRRGLGGVMTARAITDARERGYELATLVASELGRPVYERLGFVHTGPVDAWISSPPGDAPPRR